LSSQKANLKREGRPGRIVSAHATPNPQVSGNDGIKERGYIMQRVKGLRTGARGPRKVKKRPKPRMEEGIRSVSILAPLPDIVRKKVLFQHSGRGGERLEKISIRRVLTEEGEREEKR